MMILEPILVIEWSAAAAIALSVWLAARGHIATWPVGIVGCILYGALFSATQLYAEATLQVFFVVTSAIGWWQWQHGVQPGGVVTRAPWAAFQWTGLLLGGIVVTIGYGALLLQWTNAFAPFWDSAVLTTSVIAQVLLMRGRRETWLFWIVVNSLSVPLYLSRGLNVTAALYALFWLNAWYGWWYWGRIHKAPSLAAENSAAA